MTVTETKLTEKQRRFVEAYMGQAAGNATEAARLAGYKGNDPTLAAVGGQNLRKPSVQEAIQSRVVADPRIATRKDRQSLWTALMYDETEETRDRLKASELLAKSQADFVERIEHSGPGGGPVLVAAATDLRKLTLEEVASLHALTSKASV